MRCRPTAVALACALFGGPALAGPADDSLRATVQQLVQRLDRLERENQALRARLEAAAPAPAAASATADTERRLKALEQAQAEAEQALATERLSEKEPEIVTRLKAVEFQTLEMRKQASQIEALDGVTVGASLTGGLQRLNAGGAVDGRAASRANYRADVSIGLPGGEIGDIDGRLFAHFRLGQGAGVAPRNTFTGGVNGTAFQAAGAPDDAFAILAQAWYQLTIPLPRGGLKQHARSQLELNVGKIDPFVFFDQNAIADDETARFMNSAFVHNPLLDSGGDIGADAYGFAPGLRLAYSATPQRGERWGASLGVFAGGSGASFSGSLGKPLVIGQLDAAGSLAAGLPGNLRLLAWHNGRGTEHDGREAPHTGLGVSADQRLGDHWTVFGRYGHQLQGAPRFDRALTAGTELGGDAWGRGADGLGFALGWLRSAAGYRAASSAAGGERIAELYYRWQLNSRVQLTPDLQWIGRPAGERDAPAVRTIGLRARVAL